MDGLITDASAGFASTTGFSLDSVVTWMGDNILKLVAGTGFSVLYALRYWIVALVALGAIVYFGFRAFRFYRH